MLQINIRQIFMILIQIILTGIISVGLYIMVIEAYSLGNHIKEAKDNIDFLLNMQLYENLTYYKKFLYFVNELEIHNLFAKSNSVISSIYLILFSAFFLYTLSIFLGQNINENFSNRLQFFALQTLMTFGTIGSMYSISLAMYKIQGTSMDIAKVIQTAFFDAIFTTLLGLTLYVIALFIGTFKVKEK